MRPGGLYRAMFLVQRLLLDEKMNGVLVQRNERQTPDANARNGVKNLRRHGSVLCADQHAYREVNRTRVLSPPPNKRASPPQSARAYTPPWRRTMGSRRIIHRLRYRKS